MIKGIRMMDVRFVPHSGQPCMQTGEVHLWKVWLPEVPDQFSCTLNPEERQRAGSFRFERDRARFTAARGALRHLLAGYLGTPAETVAFDAGPHGKPSLKDNPHRLQFNLSHSGDLMLLAVTQDHPLGVDVEQLRDDIGIAVLAEQYFPPEDADQILSLPQPERITAFFHVWTRTEACLKAAGIGMAGGLKVHDAQRWRVQNFTPTPGYSAALAMESGADCRLASWSWPS